MEKDECDCGTTVDDVIRVSYMNNYNSKIEYSVITELIGNTKWNDVFKDNNTEANMAVLYEKFRQMIGAPIPPRQKNSAKRKILRQKKMDEQKSMDILKSQWHPTALFYSQAYLKTFT